MKTNNTPNPTVPVKVPDNGPCEVPFTEQLRNVPRDGRCWYEHGPCHHQNIPYGRLCHEAADKIDALKHAPVPAPAVPAGVREKLGPGEDVLAQRLALVIKYPLSEHNKDTILDAIDYIKRKALLPTPATDADGRDSERLDWLEMREVKVGECYGHGVELMFVHVPIGYGLNETVDLRQAIDAAKRKEVLKQCADLVRKFYPVPPTP